MILDRPLGGGALAALDPRSRTIAAGLFALVVVAQDSLPAVAAALALALLTAVLACLPPLATLRRLLALDGLMVLAVLSLPFTVPGEPAITLAGIDASEAGLRLSLAILLKANAVVLMMLALLGSMEAVVFGQALRRLGLPEKLVQIYLFTLRYLDVLHREYRRLRTAMRARAFTPRSNRHTWRSLGYLVGMLMVRSVERSERIVAAMRCRGFDGSFPVLDVPTRFRRADRVFAALVLAALSLVMTAGGL